MSDIRSKDRIKLIPIITFFICSLLLSSFGKDISFFIPEDHELYLTVDSLHKEMKRHEKEFLYFETKVIRESNVRSDKISVKGQYLNFALENKLADTASVLKFCVLQNKMYESREKYFSTLLSALEGDDRAMCFNFIKKIKSSVSEASAIDREFHEKAAVKAKPEFGNVKLSLKIEDNMDGGLEEILSEDSEEFSYSHEMTFEKRDSVEDTTSVVMLNNIETNDTGIDIEVENENSAMINSMANFFTDKTSSENNQIISQEPKVN